LPGASKVGRAREPNPVGNRTGALLLLPVLPGRVFGKGLDPFDETAGVNRHFVDRFMRGLDRVLEPYGDRIDSEFLCHHLHLDFRGKAGMSDPMSPHGCGDGIVRKNPVCVVLEIGQLVGKGAHASGQVHRQGTNGRMRAAVRDNTALHAGNGAVLFHPHLVVDDHVVPPATGLEHFFHVVHELDRFAGHLGKKACTEVPCQGIVLGSPEPPSDERLNDPHLVERQVEAGCQVAVDEIGTLLGGPNGDP